MEEKSPSEPQETSRLGVLCTWDTFALRLHIILNPFCRNIIQESIPKNPGTIIKFQHTQVEFTNVFWMTIANVKYIKDQSEWYYF